MSNISIYQNKIREMPLFTGIEEELLDSILEHSRIVHLDKHAEIFSQGESARKFYIILDGLIKLFKMDANGADAVLQIAKSGDNLLETIIFKSAMIPISAQVIESATLLAIPADRMRQYIRQNEKLAANMLEIMADKSRQFISHFEQLSLKSVSQRVGWFLLKLFIENGKANTLKLPYDKLLIASYLGMKPETFSRTLQDFKRRGINIQKDMVSLPTVFSLCDYCDIETASNCNKHGTSACPNPDCV